MKAGTRIKITKLRVAPNPLAPTPAWDAYVPGEDNGEVSLPIDYTATGKLVEDIQVGFPIHLIRDSRNGIRVTGIMITSTVEAWNGKEARTRNSIYLIELSDSSN